MADPTPALLIAQRQHSMQSSPWQRCVPALLGMYQLKLGIARQQGGQALSSDQTRFQDLGTAQFTYSYMRKHAGETTFVNENSAPDC